MADLSQAAESWAQNRGISRSTLDRLGVGSGTVNIPDLGQCEAIMFPYRRGQELVNWKARTLADKQFQQKKGGELRFWNLDAVLNANSESVYITEGEMDTLALIEAGVPVQQAVSVPNGAPPKESDRPEETNRYRYVDKGLEEGFSRVQKFILATDNDSKGQALRQDLVRLLGPARCYFVEWPKEVKDANDFLTKYGAADLRVFVQEDVREWPVTGLYRLGEIPEPTPLEIWRPGFPEWEQKLAFAPTTVSVVTGHPNHGKTTLMLQLWFQMCREYGFKAAIASFENRAKPHQRRYIRQFMFNRLECTLTDEEKSQADQWNDEHFLWIVHPNRKPTLNWVFDMAEVAVVRHNARIIQIDPWNKLEADCPSGMRETDYIGQCLDRALDFARDFNVHVQILTHPSKQLGSRDRKASRFRPELDDISGSKHWDNKSDLGLCVHRPVMFKDGERQTGAKLFVLKARYDELGYPCELELNYDLTEGRFKAVDYRMSYEG